MFLVRITALFCSFGLILGASACLDEAPQPIVSLLESQNPDELDEGVTSIVGRVLDYHTREPVVGARVESFSPTETVGTREDGGYALVRDVRAGEVYRVVVTAQNYVSAETSVQTISGKAQNVDILLVSKGDALPARLEPQSLLLSHTTHTVSMRLRNESNETLSWCFPSVQDGFRDTHFEGLGATLEIEPSLGRLEPDESIQLRFSIPSGMYASFASGNGLETLRTALEIRGDTQEQSPEGACDTGTRSLALNTLALLDTSKPFALDLVASPERGPECDLDDPDTPCEVSGGESIEFAATARLQQGSTPLVGATVYARILDSTRSNEPTLEIVNTNVRTDAEGRVRVRVQAPNVQRATNYIVEFGLGAFVDGEQRSSIAERKRVAVRVAPSGVRGAEISVSDITPDEDTVFVGDDGVPEIFGQRAKVSVSLFSDADQRVLLEGDREVSIRAVTFDRRVIDTMQWKNNEGDTSTGWATVPIRGGVGEVEVTRLMPLDDEWFIEEDLWFEVRANPSAESVLEEQRVVVKPKADPVGVGYIVSGPDGNAVCGSSDDSPSCVIQGREGAVVLEIGADLFGRPGLLPGSTETHNWVVGVRVPDRDPDEVRGVIRGGEGLVEVGNRTYQRFSIRGGKVEMGIEMEADATDRAEYTLEVVVVPQDGIEVVDPDDRPVLREIEVAFEAEPSRFWVEYRVLEGGNNGVDGWCVQRQLQVRARAQSGSGGETFEVKTRVSPTGDGTVLILPHPENQGDPEFTHVTAVDEEADAHEGWEVVETFDAANYTKTGQPISMLDTWTIEFEPEPDQADVLSQHPPTDANPDIADSFTFDEVRRDQNVFFVDMGVVGEAGCTVGSPIIGSGSVGVGDRVCVKVKVVDEYGCNLEGPPPVVLEAFGVGGDVDGQALNLVWQDRDGVRIPDESSISPVQGVDPQGVDAPAGGSPTTAFALITAPNVDAIRVEATFAESGESAGTGLLEVDYDPNSPRWVVELEVVDGSTGVVSVSEDDLGVPVRLRVNAHSNDGLRRPMEGAALSLNVNDIRIIRNVQVGPRGGAELDFFFNKYGDDIPVSVCARLGGDERCSDTVPVRFDPRLDIAWISIRSRDENNLGDELGFMGSPSNGFLGLRTEPGEGEEENRYDLSVCVRPIEGSDPFGEVEDGWGNVTMELAVSDETVVAFLGDNGPEGSVRESKLSMDGSVCVDTNVLVVSEVPERATLSAAIIREDLSLSEENEQWAQQDVFFLELNVGEQLIARSRGLEEIRQDSGSVLEIAGFLEHSAGVAVQYDLMVVGLEEGECFPEGGGLTETKQIGVSEGGRIQGSFSGPNLNGLLNGIPLNTTYCLCAVPRTGENAWEDATCEPFELKGRFNGEIDVTPKVLDGDEFLGTDTQVFGRLGDGQNPVRFLVYEREDGLCHPLQGPAYENAIHTDWNNVLPGEDRVFSMNFQPESFKRRGQDENRLAEGSYCLCADHENNRSALCTGFDVTTPTVEYIESNPVAFSVVDSRFAQVDFAVQCSEEDQSRRVGLAFTNANEEGECGDTVLAEYIQTYPVQESGVWSDSFQVDFQNVDDLNILSGDSCMCIMKYDNASRDGGEVVSNACTHVFWDGCLNVTSGNGSDLDTPQVSVEEYTEVVVRVYDRCSDTQIPNLDRFTGALAGGGDVRFDGEGPEYVTDQEGNYYLMTLSISSFGPVGFDTVEISHLDEPYFAFEFDVELVDLD